MQLFYIYTVDQKRTLSSQYMMVTAVSALSILITFVDIREGAAVAKFAADNVHQKLVLGEDYREKRYEAALKTAFLATDEDLLASKL
jgi:hypothetical protein